ncbi:MAG: CHASE2 domain-containing protein, partial [Bdellovibrionales bacterium]|nr:CHASE2 domain-containing protein [Bdellovibrionales bacterium]
LIVNYQGPPDTFESISLYELLTEPADSQRLNNRIIIFGSHNFNSHGFQSPLGPMLESEALANVVDNLIYSRFVNHFPRSIYLLLLLGIIVLSSWTVFRFNQWVSFSIHAFLALFALSFSAWSFDNLNLLLPVVPLLVVVASSYMIYLSFQSNLNEQRAWNLEKERNSYLELESLKQNFVSLFSHDLKTPIAKIQGTIERISRTRAVDQQLSSDLEILRNASLDLNRYIQSILNLSRVEASDFKLNHSPSDINEISERVAESLSSFAEEKGISLSLNLEPMFTAEFDAILIQEVIQNLIENAIKYTPKGGFVEVSTQEDENGYIHFEVRDTGPGIPEDDLQNVWNKFFRGADDPTEERKGSGLGLYLVKFFIELHGGSVFIESEVNVGTRVGFLLPVEPKLAQDKG